MTDEREENSQKDEVENKLALYIFPSIVPSCFFTVTKFDIQRIGIFGSVARGEQNSKSDLDIFVDIKEPDYFILCNIHDDLEKLCGCKVDLIHLHRFLRRPLFLKNIEKDAIMA